MSSLRSRINRREALFGAASFGAAALGAAAVTARGAVSTEASAGLSSTPLEPGYFLDPLTELHTHVKMIGSLRNEIVCSLLRLNIYADPGEGNFVPLFTMNNIVVDHWQRVDEHIFEMRKFEVGYYTEYDSQQAIETFLNPLTGKRVAIHQFKLGPVPRAYTSDGVIAMGFTPKLLPIEVIGERVFLATESIENRPDPIRPGKTAYVNSFMTLSAPLSPVLDSNVYNVPVHIQLQNKGHWQSWMGMDDRPGGTVARGYGSKIGSLDALPDIVKENARKYVPEIFDTANWTEFLFEESAMLKAQGSNASRG
jgi:hypothetical protein